MQTILSKATAAILFLLSSLSITANTDPFSFTALTNVQLNTSITSNAATISGFDSTISIRVEGGSYTIGAGSPTAAEGAITAGATVAVKVLSSGEFNTKTVATLTVGSGASVTRAIFSVTTRLDPSAPVFISNPVTRTRVNSLYQYNLGASDAEGDNLMFSAAPDAGLPSWLAIGKVVSTLAGDGSLGSDDGVTSTANFNDPNGVAIDASGNIIITDGDNNRIRKISPEGMVSTIAGSSTGFADGASATAQFDFPFGVAIDASGNIIVADRSNHRIRSISPEGMVRTVAGSGDIGSDNGASATAKFNLPSGIAIDASGNIIVVDNGNNLIRSISSDGTVTTIAGGGSGFIDGPSATAGFNVPIGVAIDASGDIIVTDGNSNRIRSISSDGTVTTIAGSGIPGSTDGASATAGFNVPAGVAIDASGNIIVVGISSNRIRSISPEGIVSTIAGGSEGFADGVSSNAKFDSPVSVAIDATNNIIVVDRDNNLIRKFDRNNIAVAGTAGCDDIGVHSLELIVSDGTLTSSQSFDIAVLDDGSCGVIPASIMLSTTNVVENIAPDSVIATISATASNALGPFEFSIVGGRDSASFSISADNQLVIDHSPSVETQSSYEIIIGVSDNLHLATKRFEIMVRSAPVFISNPVTRTRANSLYQYNLRASGAEGGRFVFDVASGTVLPSWLAIGAVVSTLAGDGSLGSDDGVTSTANFNGPNGVAIDASGNIIITDGDNNRIRKISPEGMVSTIAGSSTGFTDGASATAEFDGPTSVAIDASGNIIVADSGNDAIRRIATDGTVTTVSTFSTPRGVTIDATSTIIVADGGSNRIHSISLGNIATIIAGSFVGSTDGDRATAKFNAPEDVAIDASGNIIVADRDNHRIRKITLDPDVMVSTIAGSSNGLTDGTGTMAKFSFPSGVAIDALGNIIVADRGNNRIRSIDSDYVVSTIAGGGNTGFISDSDAGFADGVGANARFHAPEDVAIDALGNIIVADRNNNRIRKININSIAVAGITGCDDIGVHSLDLIVSDGTFTSSQSFDIVVADDGSCGAIPTNLALSAITVVEDVLANSIIATVSADDNDNPASLSFSVVGGRDSARFSISDGNQLVIDHSPSVETQSNYEIIIGVSDDIHFITRSFEIRIVGIESVPVFTSEPITSIKVNSPYQYSLGASDAEGGRFVFDAASGTVLPSWLAINSNIVSTLAGSGFFGSNDGASATARFRQPRGVAIDASGNVIVADARNSRIRKISPSGMVTTIAGSSGGFADGVSTTAKFASPTMIAIDALGNIVVADSNNNRIRSISSSGIVSTIAGSGTPGIVNGPSATARFDFPISVAVDAAGNIIVADADNQNIRGISSDGTVTTVAGNGNVGHTDGASATASFAFPSGVAIDAAGNIIVGDSSSQRIRSISPSGIVSTVAGSGQQGFLDGASATAKFLFPRGVAVDVGGDIIVADAVGNRIRRISTDGIVSTIAGTGIKGFANGDGASAQFEEPDDVAIDASGNIIVADNINNRIRKIDRTSFILKGSPSCSDIGINSLELMVSDGMLTSSQSFDIVVADDGSCGAIPTNLALSAITVVEDVLANSIIATVSADDNDNPASLSFSVVGGRDGASFSISDGNQLVIDHSPDFNTQRIYEIIISASDTIHIVTKSFRISVISIAGVPIFISEPVTSTRVGSPYQYSLNIIDIDRAELVLSSATGTTLPDWLTTDVDIIVTTLAGDGSRDNDDGATNTASFGFPEGVVIDNSGNIIVADSNNHRIRSISPEGMVDTIAGGGEVGLSGGAFRDGASATARFDRPSDVAIDASGNIIVVDEVNNRIRRIDTGGEVTTIAGGSRRGNFADGTGTIARFDDPVGIEIDASGDIIIADTNNGRIRSISPKDVVSTIAGTGGRSFGDGASATAIFFSPRDVAIDAAGNILVADAFNHRIRSINTEGIVSTFAGSGIAGFGDGATATAKFDIPVGVAVDNGGNIIVADSNNHRIRSIGTDGIVRTIAGSSMGTDDGAGAVAKFDSPTGIVINALGNIIVADRNNNRIREIDRTNFVLVGTPSCSDVGVNDISLMISDGEFESLQSFDIAVADNGSCGVVPTNLALTTTNVVENTATDSVIASISATATNPLNPFEFSIVGGRDRDSFSIIGGNQLVIDHSPSFERQSSYKIIIGVSDMVHIATKSFEINVAGIERVPVFTSTPVITARVGNLYQYDSSASDSDSSDLVFSIAPGTELPSWLATGVDTFVIILAGNGEQGSNNGAASTATFLFPAGVVVDASGNIIVADTDNNLIRNISPESVVTTIAGSGDEGFGDGASATAKFDRPEGVAINASGDIIVADAENHRIRRISPEGMVSTIAGGSEQGSVNATGINARFNRPSDVAINASGDIIVADRGNHRIRRIDSDNAVTTIAGSSAGFVNATGSNAQFNSPRGVAVEANGNIIVADQSNQRIRRINSSNAVTTIAGGANQDLIDGAGNNARFSNPRDVVIDAGGNIIVADTNNDSIRSISSDNMVRTIAIDSANFIGGGEFGRPRAVAIDNMGDIIVADSANHLIRKISSADFSVVGTPPSCDDIGIYSLELVVSDGEFSSSQSFDIAVLDNGSCGIAPTNLALSTTTVDENIDMDSVVAHISATATNPLNPFEFSIVGGRDSASFSISATNQLVINHSPDFEAQSSYEIIIGVSDAVHLITKTFNISVVNINESTPVFTSNPITTIRVNSLYQYILGASDADGNDLVFSAISRTILPDWLTIDMVDIIVTTLAGDGSTQSIDDGAASTANFNSPRDVAIDALGNIIVVDTFNHRIRSISTDGIVRTIAGSGNGVVDGASATAKFRQPAGVAIDASGNIIIADGTNHSIRKISPDGIVSTIVGGKEASSAGGAFADGASATARFNLPTGITIDNSAIIIADTLNNRIRNIDTNDMVTTIAGSVSSGAGDGFSIDGAFADGASNTAKFNIPVGVVVDALGNIIVADSFNHRIRSISTEGTVSTIAGTGSIGLNNGSFADGASNTARFNLPTGVAIDASGNIIISDRLNHRIRKISPDGVVTTIAGSNTGFADGASATAKFDNPSGIAIDAFGDIIIADRGNHRIRKINRNNIVLAGVSPGCNDIGSYDIVLIVSDGEFQSSQSFDITVLDDGSCGVIPASITLSATNVVENIASDSVIASISATASNALGPFEFSIVGGRDSASFSIINDNQLVINHSPDFEAQSSYEIIIGVSDNLHIATKSFEISVSNVNEVAPVFTSNPITTIIVDDLYQYDLRASDADGSDFVFSAASGTTLLDWLTIDVVGEVVTTLAGDGNQGSDDGVTSTASFNLPAAAAIDASGNIIISDRLNHRIRKISPEGVVTTIAGGSEGFADGASATAKFDNPSGVAIDALGNIIVADRDNHSIRSITPGGTVTTIAGTNTIGFVDGASSTAKFNNPTGIAIDALGNIIVADRDNHSIRSITPGGTVTTIAGTNIFGSDDGASSTARFNTPIGIAIDALGNIIVADRDNHRIRSISTEGTVTTVAGGIIGSMDGASSTARFNTPFGIAVDSRGNIIIADSNNNRIRSINTNGMVRTIAGSDTGFANGTGTIVKFNSPTGIAIDSRDSIIVVDSSNRRIRKIDRTSFALLGSPSCGDVGFNNIELMASDGEFESSQNFDIAVLDNGSCGVIPASIMLSTTNVVENIAPDSVIASISATATNALSSFGFSIVGGRDSASFSIINDNQLVIDHSPDFEAQNSYEIIVGASDSLHIATKSFEIDVVEIERVPVFTSTPIITTRVSSSYQYSLSASDTDSSDFIFSIAPETVLPSWLAISPIVTTLAGDGSQGSDNGATSTASFGSPTDVAIDASGNIIVADGGNHLIRSINTNGVVTTMAGSGQGFADGASNTAMFRFPAGVAIDTSGNIIVADTLNHRIRKISTNGMVTTIAGSETSFANGIDVFARFSSPTSIAIDTDGNIIIADTNNHSIRNIGIDIDRTVTTIAGTTTIGFVNGANAKFNAPTGVAIDALGNIIVADRDNHSIRNIGIDIDRTVTTIAGTITIGFVDGANAKFSSPTGVAIDALGNIIVADRGNNRIRSINPDGVVTTIAGSVTGFADGAGAAARFDAPTGVAIDALGNIIIADRDNHRIRKINRNNIVLAGIPLECGDIGSYDVVLIVSDGEFQSSQSFTINVMDDGSCLVAPFSFDAIADVVPNATISSAAITVTSNVQDPQSTFTIRIEGEDARYSINGGIYTDSVGAVGIGDSVRVQIVASNQAITTKIATISIDSIAATFAVTTADFMIAGGDRSANYNSPAITITTTITDSQVVWSSNATNVISFSDPNSGLVSIVGAGSALIRASRAGAEDSIVFTIMPLTLTPTFASPQRFIYNTSIITALVTITSGIVATDDVSLSLSGATATDVGNYNIDLTLIGTDSRNYFLSTTTLSWSIIKANQSQFSLGADTTITFGSSFSSPATGVSATVATSYGSSDHNVATIAPNGDITIIGIGSTIISATNTGDNNYNSAAASYQLTITQAPQDPFSITASDTLIFGATTTIVVVESGSGDGVVSYDSSDIAVIAITADGTISATGVGIATITATKAGGINYLDTSDTHLIMVRRASQTSLIISGSLTLANAATGFASATGGSGTGAISFSSSNPDIATITQDGVITAKSLGITTISATKSGGDNYHDTGDNYLLTIVNTTPTVANSIANQIISLRNLFNFIIPANTFNDPNGDTLTISASNLPDGLMFDSANTSITGTPTTVGISIITITADDGNGAMVSTSFSLTVSDDFIIIGNNPRTIIYGVASQNIIAQGGVSPDGAVTFVSSTPSVASFGDTNIGTLTISNVGTTIITATREGSGEQASISIIVSPRTITPTFASSQTFIYNTNIRTVLATIASGIVAGDDVSLSITGATATDVGSYNIDLTLIGTDSRNYFLSTTTLSWSIIKADQSQFSLIADTTIIFGTSFSSPATGVSTTVDTSYGSSNPNVATIDANGDITTVSTGSTIISATNTGDNNYNSAAASYQLTITQAPQDPFSITASDTLIFGATTTIVVVEGGSGDGVVSYDSSDIAVIVITADGSITAIGVGIATITATKAGGMNYLDTSDTHLIMVRRASQTSLIISGSLTLANAATGFASATGGSGTGAISFSSSNPDIATITQDGMITAQSLGVTTISATKSGGDNYHDIGDSYLLTIVNTAPIVINPITDRTASLGNLFTFPIPANTFNDPNGDTLTISASNLPDGLMFDSANTSITGTPATVGISIITITADDGNGAMASASFSLTVSDDFIIIGNNPRTIIYGVASQNIEAQGGVSPDGVIAFVSSTPSVANFSDTNIGELTISSAGTAIITATREGSGEQASISIIVSPRTITPTFAGSQTFIYNTNIRTVLATITSGIVAGDDISLSISGATATDVDNYNIDLRLIGANSPNYRLSTTTLSWSIIKADQTGFNIIISSTLELGSTAIATTRGGQGTGATSFSSSNPAVATINQDGLISAQSLGTTTLTATRTGDSNYNDGSDTTTLTVVTRFNLDIDDDGSRLTTTDGVLIIRFLTGPTNTINTTDATTTGAQRNNQQILEFLQGGYDRLDIDGNGTIAASSDGMLIMRYLADQENLNTIGIPTSVGVGTITFNLQNIYQ